MIPLRIFTGGDDSPAPEAEAYSAAMRAASRRPPFADVIDAYYVERETLAQAGAIGQKRWANERRHLRSFKRMFGHMCEGELSPRTIVAKWLLQNPQWAAPDSKKDAVNTLCAAFEWAADPDGANLIDRPLFKRSKLSSLVPPTQPRQPVYTHQLLAVFKVARRRGHKTARNAFRFALHFLFETGSRPCELRRVCWNHVDWETGIIHLPAELSKTGKKTGENRLIVLTDRMRRLIRTAWERRGKPSKGEIFLNSRSDPIQPEGFADYFRRVADLAGIPEECTAAGIRHGFAVRKLSEGQSNKRVADAMGHKSTAMIDRVYDRHVREEDLIRTVRGKKRPVP